jgi:hypothetical protein
MSTLIYAPGISVHIETTSGIIDVSDDLVQWDLDLPENAVHTFNFTLQNAQRKYDGLIVPMDRITVQLKRLNWLQNFTGYLNDGPVFQAWPATLDFTANCSLKIPQFYYWDPSSTDSQALITAAFNSGGVGEQSTTGDNGMSQLVIDVLSKVANWAPEKIHIGQVPANWYSFAQAVGNLIQTDNDMTALMGTGAIVAGKNVGTLKVSLPADTYAEIELDAAQAANASIIYNTMRFTCGLSSREAKMALMCSYAESSFHNYANINVSESLSIPNEGVQKDHRSVGLFQQQTPGWGSAAELMTPAIATQKFAAALVKFEGPQKDKNTLTDWAIIQGVQNSAVGSGSNYEAFERLGTALVDLMDNLSAGLAGATASNPIGTGLNTPTGQFTGSQIAKVAQDLILAHPPGHITYSGQAEGYHDAKQDDPDPLLLDCSSLVDWVYWHATGTSLFKGGATRSNASSIYSQCVPIPLDLAYQVQGACLFIKDGPPSDPYGHVGVSLGSQVGGQWQHVAAHDRYSDPTLDVNISSVGTQFTNAGLLPGINYAGSAATQAAATQLQTILKTATTIAPNLSLVAASGVSGANPTGTDAFTSFINNLVLNPTGNQLGGNFLSGTRALMNNQPLLPWIKNVVNGSMRSFCSAPNGDFIAWFPDYFGYWGTAGIINIEQIELQNFTVKWSDQQMVTHQFVIGALGKTAFNSDDASVDPVAQATQGALFSSTEGIATMDTPEIFQAIYGASANPVWRDKFIERFGARPDIVSVPQIAGGQSTGRAEFFMALYLFMQRWANMFTADIPLTFMPECWPGMLVRIPDFGFQAYITRVTHSGTYGQGGSFTTNLSICAPANIAGANRGDLLSLLPDGGQPLTGNIVPAARPSTSPAK